MTSSPPCTKTKDLSLAPFVRPPAICYLCLYRLVAKSLTSLGNKERILHGRAEIRNFSSSVEIFFNTRREISYLQAAMKYSVYYINTNEILNNFTKDIKSNSDLFTCENNMLSSRVKISCFRAKAHLAYHWCLYNKFIYHITRTAPRALSLQNY